jgi:hypothetical protein
MFNHVLAATRWRWRGTTMHSIQQEIINLEHVTLSRYCVAVGNGSEAWDLVLSSSHQSSSIGLRCCRARARQISGGQGPRITLVSGRGAAISSPEVSRASSGLPAAEQAAHVAAMHWNGPTISSQGWKSIVEGARNELFWVISRPMSTHI